MTTRTKDEISAEQDRATILAKPRWETPALDVLPIELTANSHPRSPTDATGAPNFS